MFFRFIEFVNFSSENTEHDTFDILIVVSHRVVLDNKVQILNFNGLLLHYWMLR